MHFSASTFLAPYLHTFLAWFRVLFWCYLGQNCVKSGANIASKFQKNGAEKAPSNGAILDQFSEHIIIQCTF